MSLRSAVTTKRLLPVAWTVVLLALTAAPAHAAFPGQNGKIAFGCTPPGRTCTINNDGSGITPIATGLGGPAWSPDGQTIAATGGNDIYTMNADGSTRTNLTGPFVPIATDPDWSPDGTKIVFEALVPVNEDISQYDIFVMNRDGSGLTNITNTPDEPFWELDPAWSPDGSKIAFSLYGEVIYLMNPDGTDKTPITGPPATSYKTNPAWSPDGSRLAFAGRDSFDETVSVYSMNRDGTQETQLTNGATLDDHPAWSPDASKIVFHTNRDGDLELFAMKPDGSNQSRITDNTTVDADPDWQPILRGYPRPQAGALFRVPLAIAYQECAAGSANRTHGPALTASSCNPATPTSDHLTVGTLDANGKSTQAVGRVKYVACVAGTTASGECSTPPGMSSPDVRVEATLNDVRQRGALSDYGGELEVTQTLRVTDKQNTPAPPNGTSGTVSDLPISYTVPCTPTPGPADVGSTCSLLTRLNALIPGSIVAGKRSNWGISQVEVYDGGLDGSASTSPNTVFARQGIFIP